MYKRILCVLLLVVGISQNLFSMSSVAIEDLFERVIGENSTKFSIVLDNQQCEQDWFLVSATEDQRIEIKGNNGVSIASGLNYYLRNYSNSMLTWCGDSIDLPETLVLPEEPILIENIHKYRPYFNYCTLSYSASWWDWERWEREIDFMALNGINMPLAVTGLEAVWYETLLEFNYSDEEARAFLSGPAFFAWQWMTNIQSHCGPLPKSWIESHLELGRKILDRERSLGMTPIQQGFSGFVPISLAVKYPNAKIGREGRWCNFPGTAQLDPLDPLFEELGTAFLKKQTELFGTSHHYAVDPFHEGAPPKSGSLYLKKVGKKIWGLLESVDSQAVWMMQSWSIRKHIAKQAPKDRLIVLDLSGEKHSFWGYPYVSGILHNFGNRINMHGDLLRLAENPYAHAAIKYDENVGFGLFMEGITQNPVYYDLAFSNIWNSHDRDLSQWLELYISRRYGGITDEAITAWQNLSKGPYKRGTDGVENSSILASRPALENLKSGPNAELNIPYDPALVDEAWALLLSDHIQFSSSDGYQFDIMDLGRQSLTNYAQRLFPKIRNAFRSGDKKLFTQYSSEYLELMMDVDRLLMTRTEYSFGKWVSDAHSWAGNEEELALYDLNASMLLTQWGPEEKEGQPHIFDYAWKEWSGLISGYYYPRWELFFNHISTLLDEGKKFHDAQLPQQYNRAKLRANDFYSEMADMEIDWIYSIKSIPVVSGEETVEVALELFEKYDSVLTGGLY